MFSGIVRHLGTIKQIKKSELGIEIAIQSSLFSDTGIKIGDSICTNGVCLTISEYSDNTAKFFIVNESLRRSTLASLEVGSRVHLESSLRVGDTIDGHFVYGHVDGTSKLHKVTRDGESYRFLFTVPEELLEFLAPKGSVSINGVSLTIGEVEGSEFSVYIVPHTFNETLFSTYRDGDLVNIEIDPIARYAVNYLNRKAMQ